MRRDGLLCLIAHRLGLLCETAGYGPDERGPDPPPLGMDYLDELYLFAEANAEDLAEDAPEDEDA